jgi:uncharacterized short protein YbdD (DUF466 family)
MEQITQKLEKEYPELKEFADWQVNDLFPTLYNHYNEVYKKIYRTDMPWNQNYAGRIATEGDTYEGIDLLGNRGIDMGIDADGKSTHMRTQNSNPIKELDGTDALFSYLSDMEYFAAYAENINFINKLLITNKDISKAIETLHGKDLNEVIKSAIESVANRGKKKGAGRFGAVVDMMNTVFIVSRLALSPVIALKQLTSTFTYADNIGVRNWIKYSMKNIAQIKNTWKEIRDNSVYMQDRKYTSITKVVEAYSQGSMTSFVPGSGKQFYLDFLMWTTKFGDRTAIMLGGMPNYNYYKDEYKKQNPNATEQEVIDYAIKKFEKDTKRTQQSGDIQDKDFFQTNNPFVRAFNMFMTTPKQYLRKEIMAVRQLMRRARGKQYKGTFKEQMRTFAMYHFVMPAIFQYVSIGMPGFLRPWRDEDDEDLLRAAAIGNLNAFFIVGEVFSSLADHVQDKPWKFKPRTLGVLQIYDRIITKYDRYEKANQQLQKLRNEGKYDKAVQQDEKVQKLRMEFIAELTTVGPSPAPALLKYWYNIGKLDDPNIPVGEAVMRVLNYSDYVIEGKPKTTKGDKDISMSDLKILNPALYNEIQRRKEEEKNTPWYQDELRRKKFERRMYEQQLRDQRR